VDQDSLAKIQQIVNAATEILRIEIVDAKRHTGILTEGLRHELQVGKKGSGIFSRRQATGGEAKPPLIFFDTEKQEVP
jgi:hypothetical protein